MEKYSVDTDEPPKTADTERSCPVCGATLVDKGGHSACPRHGTAPFESDSEDESGGSEASGDAGK